MTIKFAIITCSDTRTLETDEAGQKLEQLIAERGWECVRRVVEMDERPFIAGALIDACDNTDADIVLTCGGSGLSLRDVTPEATRDGGRPRGAGIAEAMRAHSVAITPFAMLSRAICAQRGHTLIINLPGSTKAATENWEGIVEALPHAVKMMAGEGHSTQKDLSEKLAAAAAPGRARVRQRARKGLWLRSRDGGLAADALAVWLSGTGFSRSEVFAPCQKSAFPCVGSALYFMRNVF